MWIQKEPLLEKLGVPMTRFPTKRLDEYGGLWEGYKIKNQSSDLRQYLLQLIEGARESAQQGAQDRRAENSFRLS
jgi:hypothetical protein